MNIRSILEQLGLDTTRLSYPLRTAIAACIAITLAWLLGLEHPQWSGMTVWAASLPMRGQLLEKSIFRVVGTIVGSLFGIILLMITQGQQWILIVGLSVWIGLCAGTANLVRGFASYGVMLAGYSAAMVTLLHSPEGGSSLAIGIDRMLTVLLGVLVALAVGWMFAPSANRDILAQQYLRLAGQVLNALSYHLSGRQSQLQYDQLELLAEIAIIEESLDEYAAGSLRSRQEIRAIRQLLSAQVATLLWMRRYNQLGNMTALVTVLKEAVKGVEANDIARVDVALHSALEHATSDKALSDVLAGWVQALKAVQQKDNVSVSNNTTPVILPVVLHQDWIGARETFWRSGVITLVTGLLWLATGWESGAFMMLGTAIMITVFSTADNPVQILRIVIIGQVVGAAGALACRWLAWPLASSEAGLIVWMSAFVMLGAFIAAHRRTAIVGFDYNMVLLLLLQPAWPLVGNFSTSVAVAGAVILGPLIALFAYRMVFPINGARRLRTLVTMMVHEIEVLATRPDASKHRIVWRARLYHRLLRLVRWAEKTGYNRQIALNGSFAVLLLGSAILHMDELLRLEDLPVNATDRLKATRTCLSSVSIDPLRSVQMLRDTINYLRHDSRVDVSLLDNAATALLEQDTFFRKAKKW